MLVEKEEIALHADKIKQIVQKDNRDDPAFLVGIEIEGCLLNDKGYPLNTSPLIEESFNTRYPLDYEYGNCQFEFKTEPMPFNQLSSLNDIIMEFIEMLEKILKKVYPNENAIPVFLGGNPSPFLNDNQIITDKPRYKKISEWQSSFPDAQMDGQNFRSDRVGTKIQGFHFHLQGKDAKFTTQMFNHILNLVPSSILLGANSRLIEGRVYSIYEPRIFLFDQAEGQNSGFPAITKYLDNLEEYIDYLASRQPIMASNYQELEKERHDDVRIRITEDSYRVETRIMSVQPTPVELISMIEFFIGYLNYTINQQTPLRPINDIREERMSVIRSGFNAVGIFNFVETIQVQLDNAKKGIYDLGISPEFLSVLQSRLDNNSTSGETIASMWDKKFNGSIQKTIAEIISIVWEHTKQNKPLTQ